MEMKIHCCHCNAVLRVAQAASGRWGRCPACHGKFRIPQAEDLLDETISTWIEEDFEHLRQEQHEQFRNLAQMDRQAIEQTLSRKMAHTSRKLEHALKTPATPSPAAPVKRGPATASAIRASISPPASRKIKCAAGSVDQGVAADVTDHVGAPGYPDQLQPSPARPWLVVDHCDQQGVTLAFDASWLEHEGFACSMPMRCVFTGERDATQLIARPLAFCDRGKNAQPLSPHQIEAGHENRLTGPAEPAEIRRIMGVLDDLAEPFHLAMPYYVSANQTTLSLACWSHTRQSDHGITAFVQIPDGQYALRWLECVNGRCGEDYRQLRIDVESLFGGQWRNLGEDCRRRLGVWCAFEPGERFCHFVSDADFGHHDMGLAGLVLTDRRLIYHKYHKRGQMRYDAQGSIVIEPGEHGLAVVHILDGQGKAFKSRAIFLHLDEVQPLVKAATQVKLPVVVKL